MKKRDSMSGTDEYLTSGLFFVGISAFTLWLLRREYRLRGKLRGLGSLAHVVMFVANGIFVGLLILGPRGVPPMKGLPWLGLPLMIAGLGVLIYAMDLFRSFSRWLGSGTRGLKISGIYNLSRNPQFVGYGLFILGAQVAWGRPLGWLGVIVYYLLIRVVAWVEEEHLSRVYGQAYRDYCARVPRFVGKSVGKKSISSG
jgi:protein-S-isoprenylcysteine O-methyltransferase Ste14